jgi:hypothetical protein
MGRFVVGIASVALVFGLTFSFATPSRAAFGYDSSYQFESAFLALQPGETGAFSVFFLNSGSTAWIKNSPSQVNLGVCAADKVTCNVVSGNATFASGWMSPIAYATAAKDVVAPGDSTAFTYGVRVPLGQGNGLYRFNGDLVIGSTGERLRPEGYYQDLVVGVQTVSLNVNPDFSRDEDNEVSTAVPGNGQHTYTFSTTLSGTLTFAILPASDVIQLAGGYGFCDRNQDRKADDVGGGNVFFTAVSGFSVPASSILINQTIPPSGQMTVTIDSATRNQAVRVVAWPDRNQNGGIDLVAAGDTTCTTYQASDTANDGVLAVSGRKFYFGPQGAFGAQFASGGTAQCEPVFLHDATNQIFGAGPTSASSLRYRYDANDIFELSGTRISSAVFRNELAAAADGTGSTIAINYNPDPGGVSEFNICRSAGSTAPSNLSAATGNFDAGSTADDVRLTFTAPSANSVASYQIQRALVSATTGSANSTSCRLGATAASSSDANGSPAGTTFSTVGALSVAAGKQGTFTNIDLANGGWCYRVIVQDPNVGLISFSNYVPVNIPGTSDATAPTSIAAVRTQNAGFSNTLDTGDKITIDFSKSMSIASNAIIRVTDSDCGAARNSGPAACSGANTNTVADIACGVNATCVLQDRPAGGTNNELLITMTANPSVIANGSVAGAQFPLVVTDSAGVTDLSGNAWNVTGSSDRLIL